jgi:Na+/H+-dicarboxylate symporter/ABC-type amino acid transport substrate-binding protein
MSFTKKILVGLVLGIATGLFLGEWVRPLSVIADGFVKLLQMTVLPYVTISIVSSLGSLSRDEAKRLGLRGTAILLVLWAIGLLYAFLIPLAFPEMQTASFFSTTLVMRRAPFDVVDLYIPSNPFHSLANNVVPAVVLFSVILGIAMMGLPRKQVLLDVLAVAGAAIARATNFVVKLTPYGIFAIAATAAGTLDFEQVARLQIYLITYTAVALLMAFWVLPGLVAALTPIPYGEVLAPSRDALITAFMAGDLFIVLPTLINGCKELLARHRLVDSATEALPDLLVPTAFNFPHTGKLLSLSFVLFAGWLSGAPVALHDYPSLAISGLLSFFGSLNAAVPFLLDLFRIPADTFFLFVATSVINSRFGTLIAAVHVIAIALVGTAAVLNAVTLDSRRIFRYLVITAALTFATLASLRIVFSTMLRTEFKGGEIIMSLLPRFAHPPTVIRASAPPAPQPTTHVSAAAYARARGTLVVAVLPGRLPYAFRNQSGELTGFDIEMAHQLAAELGIPLEFVETPFEELPALLAERRVDVAMSGILITPRRSEIMRFSQPYLDETLSFMVKDHLRGTFATWSSIDQLGAFRVGIANLPYYIGEVKQRAPNLELVIVPSDVDPVDAMPALDAFVMPAERGSALTLLHPAFTIVVPDPDPVKEPLAYGLPPGDTDWASLINNWIELKRKDGTIDQLYRHWILGQTSEHQNKRWSIIRNVLHWAE